MKKVASICICARKYTVENYPLEILKLIFTKSPVLLNMKT